ncbi:MAG: hypothetical protein JWP36_1513 [Paucimonas sp.]|nr:hypothetical protein [Paucimonas sp.]
MSNPEASTNPSCQRRFHDRWSHLRDQHVRTLAWLLDSPDMLDAAAPQWQGRIASMGANAGPDAAPWLQALDQDPAALHAFLAVHRFTRLGRYAEQLLAWYFREHGLLLAQGLQVRAAGVTVGEFDFLLREHGAIRHCELATKVYLLRARGDDGTAPGVGYFVGPNLADTLGAKIGKIIDRQLALSSHPAAGAVLPGPVASAGALIKGWLFYRLGEEESAGPARLLPAGLAPDHCRGFWCELAELPASASQRYLVLDRLQWLTPVRTTEEATLECAPLQSILRERFAGRAMPVMVAQLEQAGGEWVETGRGFVVPDEWSSRAGRRTSAAISPFP